MEPDARFCSNCGSSLADRSASGSGIGPSVAPVADEFNRYVPETLLTKIRAARAGGTMRGERRTVTMLFADIQGSTAAAEHLDPEEWADIVNGAFERLIAPVYRYEGTLARLQGDAILAFFGAPIAHEDDPIRAVRAGLDMLDSIRTYAPDVLERTGIPIDIRVGLNTGLVVVGEVGSDLRVEYTALGDAINVAARMEQTAEPGTVRITEQAARLLGEEFRLTEIGPVEVKGRADPVLALRVDGVAADAVTATTTSPMIGRERQRQELRGVLHRLAAGVGSVVTIVGDAGIGKSRLLAAMRQDAGADFHLAGTSGVDGDIAWIEGSCRSFDTGVPYAPFLDAAAGWLDLPDVRDAATFGRISGQVARVLGSADDDLTAFLAHVVGAPLPAGAEAYVTGLDAPALHERTGAAMLAYFEAEARHRPLVLVLNDLHWGDALSLGLAERLIALAERVPLAVLFALRPLHDEPAWRLVEVATREAAHRHTAIQLDALDDDAAGALLQRLLGDHQLSEVQREQLLQRADGNPLFVEELAGSISEAQTPVVPTSLSGLLSARLDRMDEADRSVAQAAAVVGREFGPSAVAELAPDVDVDARLSSLVRDGVLTEVRRFPSPVFAFRHVLIQEAAYDIILIKDRRRLHHQLAGYLERHDPDAPHEIARHYLASDDRATAFHWLVEAGARSTRVMSLAEAIRLFTTALEHVPPDAAADDVARLHLGLGEAYSLVPDLDHASAAYQSLADFGRASGDAALEARALNRLGFNAAFIGADFSGAAAYLDHARSVAQDAGDERGLAEYHMNACFIAVAKGELDTAIHHDEETARLGVAPGLEQIRVTGLVRRAMNLINATEFDDVEGALAEARRAATEAGSAESLAVLDAYVDAPLLERDGELRASFDVMDAARATMKRFGSFYTSMVEADAGRVALWLGDLDTAFSLLDAARRTAERQGQAFATGGASATLALGSAVIGDAGASAQHRQRALASLTLPVGDFLASTVWADLGLASLELGAWSEAEADFTIGLQASSSSRFWERPRLLCGAARAALGLDDVTRGQRLLDQSIEYAEQRGMKMFDPEHGYVAASISLAQGDPAGAESALVTAAARADELGLRLLAVEIAQARADVAAASGRDRDAEGHRSREDHLIGEIAGGMVDADVRRGFLDRRGRLEGEKRWPSRSS